MAVTDGTDTAQRAVTWAAELAGRTGAELVVASTKDRRQSEMHPDGAELRNDAHQRRLELWAETAVGKRCRYRTAFLDEVDLEDAVPDLAKAEEPDLVVIGTTGDEGRTAIGIGSLGHKLVHNLDCPIAAVPDADGAADVWPRPDIVVGVDGSDGSRQALRWAQDLARSLESPVVALHAHDPTADTYPHPEQTYEYPGEDQVIELVDEVANGSTRVERVEVPGDPVDAINREAERRGQSMIVVGTRSSGLLTDRVLGRVPMAALRSPARPTVVVRYHD